MKLNELEKLVESHKEIFENFLGDNFSDEELKTYESYTDNLAAVFTQPILSELSFDDFFVYPENEISQRTFFEDCYSSICLDHLPIMQNNPFQVSYILMLLQNFSEVLIDCGGVSKLIFKDEYVATLAKYKNAEALIVQKDISHVEIKTSAPVNPIDFIVRDIYTELARLDNNHVEVDVNLLSEKAQRIFQVMKKEKLDAQGIYKKSGLIAKDFDDNMERVKFFLKKIGI
jgi:hypothetical protein